MYWMPSQECTQAGASITRAAPMNGNLTLQRHSPKRAWDTFWMMNAAFTFAVDGEFEQSRAATVAGLGKAKYAAALIAFNRAMKALDGHPPDTLTAVRGLFEANEGVFKQMFPGKAKLLGSTEIEKQLRPLVGEAYSGPAKAVANKMASSFA